MSEESTPQPPVLTEVVDGVARLTLNRPEAANSLDMATADALTGAIRKAAADDSVGAVLINGAGARFCAGGDVSAFATADDPGSYIFSLANELDSATRALEDLAKPVVAAVHGAVAGAGLAVILSADVIIADPRTKFAFAYPDIGLTPDCGLSYLLPRAIGTTRALQFALDTRVLDAATAADWGLVTRVAAEGAALEDGAALAQRWASGSPSSAAALGASRLLLRGSLGRKEIGRAEAEVIRDRVATDDAQQRIAAFLGR